MNDQLPQDPIDQSESNNEALNEAPQVSMLRNALWCVAMAAGASLFYALRIESSLFRAVSLQLCLCAVALWAAMDAGKIRRRLDAYSGDDALGFRREATSIHYLFVAAPLMAIVVFTCLSMLGQSVEVSFPRSQQQIIGGAILAVLAASLWTVFSRVLDVSGTASKTPKRPDSTDSALADSVDEQSLVEQVAAASNAPEIKGVRAALSESRLVALLTGGTLMAATILPAVESWLAWGLSVWIVAVACEHLVRLFVAWFQPTQLQTRFVAPIDSLLREIFLSTTNPVSKAFDLFEARFGLSLRSSWTIRFFRRSMLPIAVGCLLVVWLSTCLVVIEPHQSGLERRFGIAQDTRLSPGLHTKLPWPFGEIQRYPVGIIQTMQIGFEEDTETTVSRDIDRTLLWTRPHAKEFSLVLGSETELVAINAIVYFKIAEDKQGFLDHALATSNPNEALQSLAYRVLMEQTRSATLQDLLSEGRDQFAAKVRDRLSQYATNERLGLDVVDVALINLHPPVEVAGSYLDVVNAELDSDRVMTEAKGEAAKQVLDAQQDSNGRIANSKVDAAKRVSIAGQESSEFSAVGEAFAADPNTYRLRLWFEALEQVMYGRRLFIVDSKLPDVIFDERAQPVDPVLIDRAPAPESPQQP